MAKIILFKDANFYGDARVIKDSDVPDLATIGFNDVLSSLIVIDGEWTLYRHSQWGGRPRWHVNANGGPDGDGCYPSFDNWQGENDVVSGVRRGYHD